ncbi:MAG: chromosome segregation protein SMC [Porticoccaceae bacterium]|nr:chromosome segregation protein SMC [Porticoccaceae bacterium]|tara:strand:- start:57914 stop:61411 length:3498 start_codon:yes stop_codon:yes gene_type:complete
MRLKLIKLSGFKSFVDPTTVSFPSEICAVVGPNGCGKSNVIDAVRWVLGESSARNLRGDSMADVIFNGSGARKPVGQASVELMFDNSKGRLKGELSTYNEIVVRRTLNRDGQSQYFLNSKLCRRKDITDLFLGTGLGPRSYAIIEQGTISRLIDAKPQELRLFLEEAAGISKYKDRRRDTENRIARTRDNLERLSDLREELHRQLMRLERQSKTAQQYTELKEKERCKHIQLKVLRWLDLDKDIRINFTEIQKLEVEKSRLVADHNELESRIERFQLELLEYSDDVEKKQTHFFQTSGEVTRIEQSIQHQLQREKELKRELHLITMSIDESQQQLIEDKQRYEELDSEYAGCLPDLKEAEEEEKSISLRIESVEAAIKEWQQSADVYHRRRAEPLKQSEVQQARINDLEKRIVDLSQRHSQLREEVGSFQLYSQQNEIQVLQTRLSEQITAQRDNEDKRTQLANDITEKRFLQDQLEEELNGLRERYQILIGRSTALEALQSSLDGSEKKQKWLLQSGWYYSHFADSLRVSEGWEEAVEIVLGGHLQGLIVSSFEDKTDHLKKFDSGEISLIDSNVRLEEQTSQRINLPRLSGFIQCDYSVSVAANVFAAEHLKEALSFQSDLRSFESIVTKDGIWLGSNWVRVERNVNKSQGFFKRKSELNKIGAQVKELNTQIKLLSGNRQTLVEAIEIADLNQKENITKIKTQQDKISEMRSELSALEVKFYQYADRGKRAAEELSEVEALLDDDQKALAVAKEVLAIAIDRVKLDEKEGYEFQENRARLQTEVSGYRKELGEKQLLLTELRLKIKALEIRRNTIEELTERLESQVKRLKTRKTEIEKVSANDLSVPQMQQELQRLLKNRVLAEQDYKDAKLAMSSSEEKRIEVEQMRVTINTQINSMRENLENARLSGRESITLQRTLGEQISSDPTKLNELVQNVDAGIDSTSLVAELDVLEAKIGRLGSINLAAIEEYKIESERKDYLDRQNNELVAALETLNEAIRKINQATKARFKETFDSINNYICELFPKLFGGGEAYMQLSGNDLLEAGVVLMAKPPGKRNSTIQSLSGGEKALAAITMVFAIFKLNPSPFCILDEVDAPLDDLNVNRYLGLVKEMSPKVQFIMITHNKISMQAAESLLGVTMSEAGVSRLVSVGINQESNLVG